MEIHNKNKPVVDQTPVNAIHAKDLENKKQEELENKVKELKVQRQALRSEDGSIPTDKMPEFKRLSEEIKKAESAAIRGDNTSSMLIKMFPEGADTATADPEILDAETKKEAADIIEKVIQGSKSADEALKKIRKLGYIFDFNNITHLKKYLDDRFNPDAPRRGNNKDSFQAWIYGKTDAELAALEGKQEVSQEGVGLNKEPFTEDITPEQKAKVEEQNKKDEEEAVTEIYDFNDEIKSIGTKEQFKAFLKTLVPEGVFSRIAWHNTSKPELTPREKQYYTNTRKNAEDTYKQENTFPAIIFGNNPKKATFDEVQDVDTEAVKGSGNDIVITDDLSPSIGADMNYREFVTTNADQVIPLATKENIDAFKAFVEQQKATPTPQATEQVTPQAQEVKEEKAQDVEQEVAETSEFTEEETQSAIKEYEDIMSKPGIDKLDAKREFIEKYGALGERVVDIDSNFDNILDKLGAIKTCTIEIIRT
jgi:hypothetical protein